MEKEKGKEKVKIGDEIYYCFEHSKIKRMDGDRIREVSDGDFSTNAYDLSNHCIPVNKTSKYLSEEFYFHYNQIHDASGVFNLNFPDIHEWFSNKWAEACRSTSEKQEKIIDELHDFSEGMLNYIKKCKLDTVCGVRVFRY